MTPSYADEVKARGYLTLTVPKKWSQQEINMLLSNASSREIAQKTNRTLASVSLKRKRIKMAQGFGYNSAHVKEKYEMNEMFLRRFKVDVSVADLYAGPTSWYRGRVGTLFENDKKHGGRAADVVLKEMQTSSFDIVDIDPFGSAFECYENAARVAKKGLIVTYGEMGHLRFKRLDFVRKNHGITTLDGFTVDALEKTLFSACLRAGAIASREFMLATPRLCRGYYILEKFEDKL